MAITLTTPVGRIVQGELWKPQEKTDQKGVKILQADGTQAVDYFFALAIAKQPGHTHWSQTDWGQQIWAEGHRAHPNFAPHPNFSWKIEDGDSVIPNKKSKKNCDREGFPGHWVLKLRSGFLPPTYNANGTAPMPAEAFKTGHYAQVNLSVKGNTGDSPGVYINPQMVALSGYGVEIVNTPDASEAGFGAAPLPAGASAAPLAAPGLAGLPGAAAAPAPFAPAGVAPGLPSAPAMAAAPPAMSPSSVPVAPNPAFLAGPVPPPAAPAGPQMTAKAGAFTYAQYIAQGWTDAALRAEGMMV